MVAAGDECMVLIYKSECFMLDGQARGLNNVW